MGERSEQFKARWTATKDIKRCSTSLVIMETN